MMYDDLYIVFTFLKLIDKCFVIIKKKPPSFQTSELEKKCFKIGSQCFFIGEGVGGLEYLKLFIMTR